ncbi:ATP-binding protein [Streptomyces sp. NPDC057654]|uniref:ATP-binding protein n=1 Tax=Streptomyces sp. NPDC057654 TaxID=3346196 RepID=UPI0036CC4AB0
MTITDTSAAHVKSQRAIRSWALKYDPHHLPRIRQLVTAQIHLWGLEERVDDARLVTTELVCNVKHTGDRRFRLGMRRRPDAIVIEVRDFSPVLVVFPEAKAEADSAGRHLGLDLDQHLDLRKLSEHGRGLHCVQSFADGVGVRPVPNGKVIWAKLRYPRACQA